MQKIGGGSPSEVAAVRSKRPKEVVCVIARMPLFGRPSGVILHPKRLAGQMLVPRWENGKGRNEGKHVPKWTVVPGGVFAAIRQTQHILNQYGTDIGMGEKSDMFAAMRLARELNVAILTAPPGTDAEAMRERLRDAIMESSRLLGMPRTLSKKGALALLAAIGKGGDARGRPNPSALMARSVALQERLRDRFEQEVLVIDPMIEARQKAFIEMVQLAFGWLTALDDYLAKLLAYDGLRPLLTSEGRSANMAHLTFFANEIGGIDFDPFRLACEETVVDLRRCVHLLRYGPLTGGPDGKLAEIRRRLINCRNAVALKAVQIDLERSIFRMTQALAREDARYPFSDERRRLNALLTRLDRLDERWMRKRVVAEARANIIAALDYAGSSSTTYLRDMRNLLKDASVVL